MSRQVITDTDILIDISHEVPEAVTCIQELGQHYILAISSVTEMELVIGCRNKKDLQILERFLKPFKIVNIDEHISNKAVDLLKQYNLSHGLLMADALIAATAIALDAPLISKNQRDYRFIAELDLLPYSIA